MDGGGVTAQWEAAGGSPASQPLAPHAMVPVTHHRRTASEPPKSLFFGGSAVTPAAPPGGGPPNPLLSPLNEAFGAGLHEVAHAQPVPPGGAAAVGVGVTAAGASAGHGVLGVRAGHAPTARGQGAGSAVFGAGAPAGVRAHHRRAASDSTAFLGKFAGAQMAASLAAAGASLARAGAPDGGSAAATPQVSGITRAQSIDTMDVTEDMTSAMERFHALAGGAASVGTAVAVKSEEPVPAASAPPVAGGQAKAGGERKRTRTRKKKAKPKPTGVAAEAAAAAKAAVPSVADGKGGIPASDLDDKTAVALALAPAPQKFDATSLDPKKARRVLANRQSAQRSRLRKIQYISELEKRVNAMQDEAEGLEKQVDEFRKHTSVQEIELQQLRVKLNSLNSQMQYKDAVFENLKSEVETLRQAEAMHRASLQANAEPFLPDSAGTFVPTSTSTMALSPEVPLIEPKGADMWPSGPTLSI